MIYIKLNNIYLALINAPPPAQSLFMSFMCTLTCWGEMPDCAVTVTKATVRSQIYLAVQRTDCVIFFNQPSFGALLLLLSFCCCHLFWQICITWKEHNNNHVGVVQELAIIVINKNKNTCKLIALMLHTQI